MSLTFMDSKSAIPIAKIRGDGKIIFLLPDSDVFQKIPSRNINQYTYKCPYCKVTLKSKQTLIHHVTHSCEKKNSVVMHTKTKITAEPGDEVYKLPLEKHEIIMVTGNPGCGKSYWVNEFVKSYIKLFERIVFLITRLEKDETLAKNEHNYVKIDVDNSVITDPFKLNDFEDSLVIFDDIESSECPKATQLMYNLMDDISKNGRHHNISVIFCNQECRMGKKTKPILSMLTGLVIFPQNCSTYQTEKLLKEQIGLGKDEINTILHLPSRWVYLNRSCPQYVLHQHGAYMLGKEIYSN